MKVLIFGNNDFSAATAIRLFKCGFNPLIVSYKISFDLYGHRNYSQVLRLGSKEISNVNAVSQPFLIENGFLNEPDVNTYISYALLNRMVPVIELADCKFIKNHLWDFCVITEEIDQEILNYFGANKISLNSLRKNVMADYYISDSDLYSGKVIYPDQQEDFEYKKDDFIKSNQSGVFFLNKKIGEKVFGGEKIASINNFDIFSDKDGFINGAVSSGLIVPANANLVDIRTHFEKSLVTKHLAFSGGVLEAIMYNKKLQNN